MSAASDELGNGRLPNVEQTQTIISGVVMQHADETAFAWLVRDAGVSGAQYFLSDLARLDGRVEAHLDWLQIAGRKVGGFVRSAGRGGGGEVFRLPA
jgi:hypothetical protein